MKTYFIVEFYKTMSKLLIVILLAATIKVNATTHVIKFGGSIGLAYSPNSLNVSLGDTVRWEGDFSMHPLSSTSVPTGAQNFHQATGSVFSYPVTVAGLYQYQCDFHFSAGMTGSFNTDATGIENNQTSIRPDVFKLEQNFPNPFNPSTMISFEIPIKTFVSIKVYNVLGEEVATLVSKIMSAGRYSKEWNASSLPSGVYLYELEAGSFSNTRKLILLK